MSAGRHVVEGESAFSQKSRADPFRGTGSTGQASRQCPITSLARLRCPSRSFESLAGVYLSKDRRGRTRAVRDGKSVWQGESNHMDRWGGDTDRACHRAQFKSNLRHDRVSWSLVVARQLPRLRPLRQSRSNRACAAARGRSLTPLSAECGSLKIGKTRRKGQGRCAPSPVQKCGTRDRPRRESHGRIKDRADTSVSRSIGAIDRRIGRRSAPRSHAESASTIESL